MGKEKKKKWIPLLGNFLRVIKSSSDETVFSQRGAELPCSAGKTFHTVPQLQAKPDFQTSQDHILLTTVGNQDIVPSQLLV